MALGATVVTTEADLKAAMGKTRCPHCNCYSSMSPDLRQRCFDLKMKFRRAQNAPAGS